MSKQTANPGRPVSARRKPTLRTIAEATGFAVATVSRALAGDPRIAEATRQTVREAAAQLGYVPDRAAQRLRTGRTKVISLLLNPEHEFLGFTNELLAGITETLRGTGYAVSVIADDVHGDRVEQVRAILRQNLADGLVFTRTEPFDPRVRLLLEHRFPFVTHGRTEFGEPHPYVDFDNERFARDAVAYLAACGCRNLSIILPPARYTFAQHLRYGFLSAVRDAGLHYVIPDAVTLESPPGQILDHVRRQHAGADRPDGHVCVGEVAAMATLAALTDAGAGPEIVVAAKRASPVFELYRPRVAAQFEDIRAVGRTLGALLLRRIEGAAPEELQVLQQPQGRFERPKPAPMPPVTFG